MAGPESPPAQVRGNGRTNKMQAHGVSAETISTKDTECPSSQVRMLGRCRGEGMNAHGNEPKNNDES